MSNYRRSQTAGASYFFTVVTLHRKKILTSDNTITILRDAFRKIKTEKPFEIEAIVILPDHLHCIWNMPEGDADYSNRWREIKKYVTKRITTVRNKRKAGNIWQPRFWEHQIRDQRDWRNHMDYIHFNPVKHGYVNAPVLWQYSSFHKWVKKGAYDPNWGNSEIPQHIRQMDKE
jgi:putative transposase